jgi:hydroxymethylpyrimidine/phosphomethylpyrimidine kinase
MDLTGLSEGSNARPVLLTIAGFDPSSGAGVTADLKVFAAHGCFGMACITALTVQSTQGVRSVEPVDPGIIRDTLETLRQDEAFDGIKIGMMGTASAVAAVTGFLRTSGPARERVLLDPVMTSSSGRQLLDPAGVIALKRDLLGVIGCITPNLDELALLTGMAVERRDDIPAAAMHLKETAQQAGNPALAVLVTGGHLAQPDDYLLCADRSALWLPGERVQTTSTHGTGCALSSALLCQLALGEPLPQSAAKAKAYVTQALRTAYPIGKGQGTMNHLFKLD